MKINKFGAMYLVALAITTVAFTAGMSKPAKKYYKTYSPIVICSNTIKNVSADLNTSDPLNRFWNPKATITCGNGTDGPCQRIVCRFVLLESAGDGTFNVVVDTAWLVVDEVDCGQSVNVSLTIPHNYPPNTYRVHWYARSGSYEGGQWVPFGTTFWDVRYDQYVF